jgi:hypothetical protein
MRAAISLFVTSLVFSSLAFNSQSMTNSFSNLLPNSDGSEQLLSAKPSGKQPKKQAPYRGSGRNLTIEQLHKTSTTI